MRHLMTSFPALHWAAFFSLPACLCIDGGGLYAALALSAAMVGALARDVADTPLPRCISSRPEFRNCP